MLRVGMMSVSPRMPLMLLNKSRSVFPLVDEGIKRYGEEPYRNWTSDSLTTRPKKLQRRMPPFWLQEYDRQDAPALIRDI
jgi:hypothetical protein